MYKLIGAVLVVTASTGFGLWKAGLYSERDKELQQVIAALQMFETEIAYGSTPLPEALGSIGGRIPGKIGSFLTDTGRAFSKGHGQSASQIIKEQLKQWQPKIHLLPQDQEILLTFAQTLGISDRSDQIRHIRLAVTRLSQEAMNARDEKERLGKMWRYLGALMGLAGVIVMY